MFSNVSAASVERKVQVTMAAGLWQGLRRWSASGRFEQVAGSRKLRNRSREHWKGEGILDAKVGGRLEPIYQESTWKDDEATIAGLVCKIEGMLRCSLTGKIVDGRSILRDGVPGECIAMVY